MNVFYSGKPRSGKTKAAVIWILWRLMNYPGRCIVTNVALKLHPWVDGKGVARKGLLRILLDRYGSTFDAERRIVLITHEQVRRFYAVRPILPCNDWEPVEVKHIDAGEHWAFDGNQYKGVDYVIDEVHVYWPAQGMPAAKELPVRGEDLGYFTQSGRCGDEVILISQVLTNVNVKLRGVAQECHWFTNHRLARLSYWRQPDKISYKVFASTPPGPSEQHMAQGILKYSRDEIESSYNTAEGVGVSGNAAADIGVRAKGLPMWTIGVLGVAVIGLVVAALFGFSKITQAVARKFAPERTWDIKSSNSPSAVASSSASFSPAQWDILKVLLAEQRLSEEKGKPVKALPEKVTYEPDEIATGFAGSGNSWTVILGDGSRREGRQFMRWSGIVKLDGVTYQWRPGWKPKEAPRSL